MCASDGVRVMPFLPGLYHSGEGEACSTGDLEDIAERQRNVSSMADDDEYKANDVFLGSRRISLLQICMTDCWSF